VSFYRFSIRRKCPNCDEASAEHPTPDLLALNHGADSPLQSVDVQPAFVANDAADGSVNGTQVGQKVTQYLALLACLGHFARLLDKVRHDRVFGPRRDERIFPARDMDERPAARPALLFDRE
jgi:hypothetical protein